MAFSSLAGTIPSRRLSCLSTSSASPWCRPCQKNCAAVLPVIGGSKDRSSCIIRFLISVESTLAICPRKCKASFWKACWYPKKGASDLVCHRCDPADHACQRQRKFLDQLLPLLLRKKPHSARQRQRGPDSGSLHTNLHPCEQGQRHRSQTSARSCSKMLRQAGRAAGLRNAPVAQHRDRIDR